MCARNKQITAKAQLIQKLSLRLEDEFKPNVFGPLDLARLLQDLAKCIENFGTTSQHDIGPLLDAAVIAREFVQTYVAMAELPSEWALLSFEQYPTVGEQRDALNALQERERTA